MHECLRRGALQNLPISIRAYAQAVASGSNEELERVVTVMTRPENRSKLIFLLPAVYPLLDPARIPNSDPDHLATLTPAETDSYIAAMLALEALSFTEKIPSDVGPELWSRVWRWFRFFEIYHQVHEDEELDYVVCSRVVSCADCLDRSQMGHVVRSTPEFYSIVARAWIAALTLTQSDSRDRLSYVLGLLSSVATFFTKQELCTKETLKVFIHNHDPSVLATWFLRHGEFSFKLIGDLRMERIGYGMLGYGVLIVLPTFLRGIHDAAENLDINELPSRFLVELVNQGVIGFVVRAVHALATSRASQSAGGNLAHLVSACTYFLAKLLEDERFKQARTAISVALIRCIAVCGEQPDLAEMTGDLVTRLWILLPSYTIHWGDQSGVDVVRVLAEYEQTIPKFAPEVREAWTRFVVVAKHRAEFADSVDSSGIVNMKACDNTLCTRLGPKNEFKRCSGCEALYYCSIQCQAVDWHNGHRAACKTHDYQLSGRVPFATPRQRAFARAMLHRDYTHLKLKIFVQAVACMRVSRDPHAGYFVVFDYSQGGPALGVYSLVEPSDALDWLARAGIQWDLTVARAARSEGRMTIHAVRVREAKAPRHWVVPLHSDSGVIHEELVKMACAQDGENQTEDFKELVDRSNSEVLEFH